VRETLAGERGQRSDEIQAMRCAPVSFFPAQVAMLSINSPLVQPTSRKGPSRSIAETMGRLALPARLVATKPRYSAKITRLEKGPLQQNTSLLVIIIVARHFRAPHPG
jgi:hypothetical protein